MLESVPRPTGSTDDAKYGALTARIPLDLLEELKEVARKKERSLNYVAARVLRRGLDDLKREGWADAAD
jgi:predicted transcriptional regulator